jgi:hypothetical protein
LAASSPQLARHGSGVSGGSPFKPSAPLVVTHQGPRHPAAVSLTSSTGGIPRRASNGALDENKPSRPEVPHLSPSRTSLIVCRECC